MTAGGVLGIMFVALLRRVMVEDAELPFPESIAASEIHKAGAMVHQVRAIYLAQWVLARLFMHFGQFNFLLHPIRN